MLTEILFFGSFAAYNYFFNVLIKLHTRKPVIISTRFQKNLNSLYVKKNFAGIIGDNIFDSALGVFGNPNKFVSKTLYAADNIEVPKVKNTIDAASSIKKLNKIDLDDVKQVGTKGTNKADDILIQRHGTLKKNKYIKGQSHHLNQDAAFRDVIPREEGMAIKLEGNIFTDVGSPHYNAHKSMEEFWSKYRKGGELDGLQPKIVEYNKALYEALQKSGLTKEQSIKAMREAVKQQLDYGLSSNKDIPRMPGKINLK